MVIKERDASAMLKFFGVIFLLGGVITLSIKPTFAGILMYFIGYIREKQLNNRF